MKRTWARRGVSRGLSSAYWTAGDRIRPSEIASSSCWSAMSRVYRTVESNRAPGSTNLRAHLRNVETRLCQKSWRRRRLSGHSQASMETVKSRGSLSHHSYASKPSSNAQSPTKTPSRQKRRKCGQADNSQAETSLLESLALAAQVFLGVWPRNKLYSLCHELISGLKAEPLPSSLVLLWRRRTHDSHDYHHIKPRYEGFDWGWGDNKPLNRQW